MHAGASGHHLFERGVAGVQVPAPQLKKGPWCSHYQVAASSHLSTSSHPTEIPADNNTNRTKLVIFIPRVIDDGETFRFGKQNRKIKNPEIG